MNIKKNQLFLLTFLLSLAGLNQQPLNFSFEKESVEGTSRPWGWQALNWNANFKMDTLNRKDGRYALKITGLDSSSLEQIEYNLDPFQLKGNTLSFSVYIKGENISDAAYLSFLYFKTNQPEEKEFKLMSKELKGTFDWKMVTVTVPKEKMMSISKISLNLSGTGTVWFDQLSIAINGKSTSELAITAPPTKREISRFNQLATPFNSPLPESSTADLAFFKDEVGESSIIALGESTHGTSEFFSLKHKLFRYAVEELNVRVFAMEDHLIVAENIDRFVKTGIGNAKESMAGCFDVWYREEVVKLIQYIRDFNTSHPNDMISFIGIDMQNLSHSIDQFSAFLSQQDPDLYDRMESDLEYFRQKEAIAFTTDDSLEQKNWIAKANVFYTTVASHQHEWLTQAKNRTDSTRVLYGVRYASLIKQRIKMFLNRDVELSRDQSMADNVIWYRNKINPSQKMVIWAHDVHVSRGDHLEVARNMHSGISLGSYLSKEYNTDFKSFGFFSYQGFYRAFKTYKYAELIDCPLTKAPKGSLEEIMHQASTRLESANLYFRMIRSEKWLTEGLPTRFANHVNCEFCFWTRYSIPYQFDGVFFIDQTTSAQLID